MAENKAFITHQLQSVKRKSGKSYSQLAKETGLTNVYVAQLLRRQAQLKPETAPKLQAALPDLPQELIKEMMIPPLRSYDPNLIQDPTIYRLKTMMKVSVDYMGYHSDIGILMVKWILFSCVKMDVIEAKRRYYGTQLFSSISFPDCLKWFESHSIMNPIGMLNEAVMHFGESIKEIINEEFGDGIMSAIDFYCSVDKVKGVDGKDRIALVFDGKYLPHSEQKSEHMVSRLHLE
ncbi:hypothetical protein ACE6H2_000431 [Prunus campanulata]